MCGMSVLQVLMQQFTLNSIFLNTHPQHRLPWGNMTNMIWVMKTCFIRKIVLYGPENNIDGNMVTVFEILRGFCKWSSLIVQIFVFVLFAFEGRIMANEWELKGSLVVYYIKKLISIKKTIHNGREGNIKPNVKHQIAIVISSYLWVLLSFLINDSFHLAQFTLGKQLELWFKWQPPLSNY